MSGYRRSMETRVFKATMSLPTNKPNSGHFPGYLRGAFLEAIEAYELWETEEPEPTIEVGYDGGQKTVSEVFRKLWNCTDIMPCSDFDGLASMDVYPKTRTYAAAARSLTEHYKNEIAKFQKFERSELHETVGYDS
jgi:hypothetical protein